MKKEGAEVLEEKDKVGLRRLPLRVASAELASDARHLAEKT